MLAIAFLLLTAADGRLAAFSKALVGDSETFMHAVSFVVSFGVTSLLFALMFKWLPDTQVAWRDVWFSALVTAALFEIGKFLIGFYIGKQGLESTYGASASIVVVLIWVYYSAQIVLFGAELTNMRAKQAGRLVAAKRKR